MLAATESVNWVQLVTVVCTMVTAIMLPYIAVLGKRAETATKVAAGQVEEVKDTLRVSDQKIAKQLAKIEDTGVETHILVNSALGSILEEHAITSRELANETKNEAHVKKAEFAERQLRDHQERQAVVDQGNRVLTTSDKLAATKSQTKAP